MQPVPFEQLKGADLVVDQIYSGGSNGNAGDDPINPLLQVGNMGGFRSRGSLEDESIRLIVLYTSGEHFDWPDTLDPATGTLVYFGDNRKPGHDLHDTPRKGNAILSWLFGKASAGAEARRKVPPVFVFSKSTVGRDVVFRGLAVPGSPATPIGEELVAVWRSNHDRRFQNYRATFTILDEANISRSWINDILSGNPHTASCPSTWQQWISAGTYRPLRSEQISVRSRAEQLPDSPRGLQIIEALHQYFNTELVSPFAFEQCAVDLWKIAAPATGEVNLTRPWRDGGRDAIGTYALGTVSDRLMVEFALEAKCYGLANSVGVREMSRLISRLRHRQFGVFVTTSYFDRQAYLEVRQDQHPVVLMCARDTVEILASIGVSTISDVSQWLRSHYPAA